MSDALTTWQLLQVTNINMWAHHQLPAPAEQLSKEEQLTAGVVASCQAALLSSCLLPVYTLQKGTQLLDYCALPAVRLLLEWVSCHPAVLAEKGFTTRPQICTTKPKINSSGQLIIIKATNLEGMQCTSAAPPQRQT